MKMYKYLIVLFSVQVLSFCNNLFAQRLDFSERVELNLSDGTEVILYPALGDRRAVKRAYYYIPNNLRISVRDSVPEFSLLVYRKGESSEVDGGILHMLLMWGLDTLKLKEAQNQLFEQTDSLGIIFGAVHVQPAEINHGFDIVSDSKIGQILKNSFKSTGHLPVTPGGKMATSFSFDSEAAKIIFDSFTNPDDIEPISIKAKYKIPYARKESELTLVFDLKKWLQQLSEFSNESLIKKY